MSHLRKTTQADYEEFISRCKYWQTYLCPDYELFFDHKELKDTNAQVTCNKQAGNVEVSLSTKRDGRQSIDRLAFHEMLEVMLYRFGNEASAFLSKYLVDEISHEIIRKLENMVFSIRKDERRR